MPGVAGEREDPREDRAYARRGAHAERRSEKGRRAAAARSLDELGRDQPVEPRRREESHEREAERDQNDPGDLRDEAAVVLDEPARQRGRRAERDEDRREPGDEREARDHHPPAADARGDARDGREVAGDERQDARRREGHEPREERERDLALHLVVEVVELVVDAALELGIERRPRPRPARTARGT